MKLEITIEGGEEIARKLAKFDGQVGEVVRAAALAGVDIIRQEIERTTPREEGDLAGGWISKYGSQTKNGGNAVVTIKDRSLQYAFYLEFGAPGRARGGTLPARPFIRPAFEAKRDTAAKEVETAIKRTLGL